MDLHEGEMRLNQKEKKENEKKGLHGSTISLFVCGVREVPNKMILFMVVCCLQWRFFVTVYRDSDLLLLGSFGMTPVVIDGSTVVFTF